MSDDVVTAIETHDVRPRLAEGDWAGRPSRSPTDCAPAGPRAVRAATRVGARCRSGSSSAGSRWSVAGRTPGPQAATQARDGARGGRSGAPGAPDPAPGETTTISPTTRQRAHRARRRRQPPSTSSASRRPSSATRRCATSARRWSSRAPSWCRPSRCASASTTRSRTRRPAATCSARSSPVRHRGPAARRPVGRLRPPPRPKQNLPTVLAALKPKLNSTASRWR